MALDAVPVSMVMTCDDAVLVRYADGSQLQLSSCGSSFLYTPPYHPVVTSDLSVTKHPLYASSTIQQRTCFATSTYRSKVLVALDFRNRFAYRPYLFAPTLLDANTLELYADITHAEWPLHADDVTVQQHSDYSLELTSTDSLATLVLSPNGQDFSVRYLCKLPEDRHGHLRGMRQPSHEGLDEAHPSHPYFEGTSSDIPTLCTRCRLQSCACTPAASVRASDGSRCHPQPASDGGGPVSGAKTRSMCRNGRQKSESGRRRCRFWYAWVVQSHSVAHCPPCWKHPLELILRTRSEESGTSYREVQGCQDQNHHRDQENACKRVCTRSTPLPQCLPRSCERSHLHRCQWAGPYPGCDHDRTEDALFMSGRRPSVLCLSNVVYRLFSDPVAAVEIYPGDGSVIVSCDGRGSFFRLVRPGPEGTQEERMISSVSLPPDVRHSEYSVADIVHRGMRLLQYVMVSERFLTPDVDICCWKEQASPVSQMTSVPDEVHEEVGANVPAELHASDIVAAELSKIRRYNYISQQEVKGKEGYHRSASVLESPGRVASSGLTSLADRGAGVTGPWTGERMSADDVRRALQDTAQTLNAIQGIMGGYAGQK
ncbi:uncharacterized protein C5orf34 homolog [Diadema setosum]|uniref:uncharacterized protein C5orf34 homolog n=1 Tax=Diadema setosum TaxID=31175 RepID=UPI003B3A7F10